MKKVPMALAALCSIALAACGTASDSEGEGGSDSASDSPSDSGPIVIGSALDSSGPTVSYDRAIRAGIEAGVEFINSNGGIDGREIEYVTENTGGDPQNAVPVTQKLLGPDGAVALLNGVSSSVTAAAAATINSGEVPTITASVVPEDSSFIFSTFPAPQQLADIQLAFLEEMGWTRVALIVDATPFSQIALQSLEDAADEYGVEFVKTIQYEVTTVDMRSQVNEALESDPQALVKLGGGPSSIVAAKAMAQAGTDVPLLHTQQPTTIDLQAAEAHGNSFSTALLPAVIGSTDIERSQGMEDFLSSMGDQDLDLANAAEGWDAVMLYAYAVSEAGTTEGAAVRDALESGVAEAASTQPFAYTAEAHSGYDVNPFVIVQWSASGVPTVAFSLDR